MASALEAIGLEPIIVMVPEHCFLGWRILPGSKTCQFLETTMIGSASFDEALDYGSKEYNEHYDAGDLNIIDIKQARSHGLMPIN